MLKAIHAQEDRAAAEAKSKEVATRLKAMKLKSAADLVEQKAIETLTYYSYPSTHWRQSEPTIRSSGLSVRFGDALVSLEPFPTGTQL
jgi:transposase-like protein